MTKTSPANRNDLCPCGSGWSKYKRCCVKQHQADRSEALRTGQEARRVQHEEEQSIALDALTRSLADAAGEEEDLARSAIQRLAGAGVVRASVRHASPKDSDET